MFLKIPSSSEMDWVYEIFLTDCEFSKLFHFKCNLKFGKQISILKYNKKIDHSIQNSLSNLKSQGF